MSHQRVVITGLGPVTPIGVNKDEYWQNLLAGVSGTRQIQFPDQNMDQYRTRIAAPVQDFNAYDYLLPDKKNKYLGRPTLFALAGAKMALQDAGFKLVPVNGHFEVKEMPKVESA